MEYLHKNREQFREAIVRTAEDADYDTAVTALERIAAGGMFA